MHIAITGIDELSAAQIARWDELLLTASPVRSAFLSYAFAKAVHDLRDGVSVILLQNGNGREGFLPVQIRRGRAFLGHAEKAGGILSDFFGVVGDIGGPVDSDQLLRATGLSSLRFDHAVKTLCPFSFEDEESGRGARLQLEDFARFKEGLLNTNKKFAQSVASRERRLARELGEVVFHWQAEQPEKALEKLIAAKRSQYRRTGVPDSLESEWHRRLLNHLMHTPGPACTAVVSTLHAGGHWIGSKFSLLCGDTLHSWFSAYDPAHRRHGPGHLVWFRTIEEGFAHGVRTFDFGEGEADYKAEYGGQSYDVFKGVIRRKTLRGRAERVLQAAEWRIAEWKRRRMLVRETRRVE